MRIRLGAQQIQPALPEPFNRFFASSKKSVWKENAIGAFVEGRKNYDKAAESKVSISAR